ncbi:MAG: sulfur carrier protein ThiS [Gammaproteobacteria bacterium]
MIKVTLNSERKEIEQPSSLQQALVLWGYGEGMVAVAIDGQVVPQAKYDETMLQAGHDIVVIAPMQGG